MDKSMDSADGISVRDAVYLGVLLWRSEDGCAVERDASFGRLLKKLRKTRDLTQEALAQQAYCAVDTIRKIETGRRRPSRQLATQFADCLGLGGDERATFLAAARAVDEDAAVTPASTAAMVGDASAPLPPTRRGRLPAPTTSFVGRATEVAAVRDLLARPMVRLLTLTGSGGSGKTRLALQVAAELLEAFADEVFFVDLAPLSDPTLVVATIAQTLGVTERGRGSLLERLKAELREQEVLLLLDNYEQVLEAAPQLAELLMQCPKLKLLVTSREVLHLYGEHEYGVPPLALPDRAQLPPLDRLTQYDAVRLFIERAQAAKADFALTTESAPAVAEICCRLDGLPLALELAAARSKLFSPQALLSRLEHRLALLTGGGRDLPARHQTIRGAIDWSYNLLSAAEQL